jgi:hypothetical protein
MQRLTFYSWNMNTSFPYKLDRSKKVIGTSHPKPTQLVFVEQVFYILYIVCQEASIRGSFCKEDRTSWEGLSSYSFNFDRKN